MSPAIASKIARGRNSAMSALSKMDKFDWFTAVVVIAVLMLLFTMQKWGPFCFGWWGVFN